MGHKVCLPIVDVGFFMEPQIIKFFPNSSEEIKRILSENTHFWGSIKGRVYGVHQGCMNRVHRSIEAVHTQNGNSRDPKNG